MVQLTGVGCHCKTGIITYKNRYNNLSDSNDHLKPQTKPNLLPNTEAVSYSTLLENEGHLHKVRKIPSHVCIDIFSRVFYFFTIFEIENAWGLIWWGFGHNEKIQNYFSIMTSY